MKPGKRSRATSGRSIFDACPVPLLEEDISGLRTLIAAWRAGGIRDLRDHLDRHPGELREAIRSIRIVDANPAACRLYEASRREELLGPLGPGLDLDDDATLAGFARAIHAIAEGRDYVGTTSHAVTLSGKTLDVESRTHIPAPGDPFPNAIVALIDMAAHRQLERRLERQRAMLQSLVDAIPDQVFLKDCEGTYLLANRALVEWADLGSLGELVGKTDLDLFPRDVAEKFRGDDRAIVVSGEGRENIEEQIGSGAKRRWALTTKVPFRDEEGSVAGIVGIVRDISSLKRTEEALRDSEERHRAVVDGAPVGIFRTTLEGKILYANPAFARMVGHATPEDLIATVNRSTVAEVLYQDPLQRAAFVREAQQDGDWHRHTVRMRRRDGGTALVTLTVRAVGGPVGAARNLEGFVEDITERTQAEEALARENALLTALMDTSPDHIYFKDRESRFIRVNRAHLALLGVDDPAQVIGKTDFDFFVRAHAEKARADELRIIATGESLLDVQERLAWPGRPDTWVSTSKIPLRNEKGAIIGTFGISRDITERRRLEERSLRLAALVESSDDAIVGLDTERRVTIWNRGAERIYGYTAEEALGRPAVDFIPPGHQEEAVELRDRVMRGEFVDGFETVRRRKDGKDIHVSLSLSPIRDSDGKIVGTASIARDITARKALQAQVLRVQRLESLRTLAGGVAHQFNNITMVVKGYLDILAAQENLSTKGREYVDLVRKAVQRAVEITKRMQGLSDPAPRPGEGTEPVAQVEVALRPFAQRIADEGVEVVRELAGAPTVRLSSHQLGFIVSSLVTNALDAMLGAPRRVLTVRCGTESAGAFLEVSDTGCGIPPEGLARIFTPFYSTKGEWAGPGSPQSAVRGVGLSLSVCQSMVAESGGRIEVYSEAGTGATFRVWLPAREAGA